MAIYTLYGVIPPTNEHACFFVDSRAEVNIETFVRFYKSDEKSDGDKYHEVSFGVVDYNANGSVICVKRNGFERATLVMSSEDGLYQFELPNEVQTKMGYITLQPTAESDHYNACFHLKGLGRIPHHTTIMLPTGKRDSFVTFPGHKTTRCYPVDFSDERTIELQACHQYNYKLECKHWVHAM